MVTKSVLWLKFDVRNRKNFFELLLPCSADSSDSRILRYHFGGVNMSISAVCAMYEYPYVPGTKADLGCPIGAVADWGLRSLGERGERTNGASQWLHHFQLRLLYWNPH